MLYGDRSILYTPVDCTTKNVTLATLDVLRNEEIDVMFGPTCSYGQLTSVHHITNLTSPDLVSSELSGCKASQFAAAATNQNRAVTRFAAGSCVGLSLIHI